MSTRKAFPKDSVCKPCWELRYCPYGPLVELFPGISENTNFEEMKQLYKEPLHNLSTGKCKTEEDVWSEVYRLFYLDPTTWDKLREYDPEDISCKIFGHTCPVFLS